MKPAAKYKKGDIVYNNFECAHGDQTTLYPDLEGSVIDVWFDEEKCEWWYRVVIGSEDYEEIYESAEEDIYSTEATSDS